LPSPPPPGATAGQPGLRTNALLFLATVVTTIMAGALQSKGAEAFDSLASLLSGVPFSAALLGILLAHEMGHYLTSRHYGVPASLPYFIPVPTIIGTMGAVIRMRAMIRDRKILFDIGIAGPLAGLVVAVPATLIGLKLSQVIEVGSTAGGIELGDSLLFMALTSWVFGPLADTQTVLLHPVAFAGWLGFFLTSLNLLPMGQLDGGHVTYGIFGPHHRLISRGVFVVLLLWGVHGVFTKLDPIGWLWAFAFCGTGVRVAFSNHGSPVLRALMVSLGIVGAFGNLVPSTTVWVVWAVLMCFLRLDHPPTRDIAVPLTPGRKILGWLGLIVFLLTFIPEPFQEILP
jgi:membrane-associated protease RseP (regulator of RpoE activity)